MHRTATMALFALIAVLLGACAGTGRSQSGRPSSPLSIGEAKPLVEMGLCRTRAEYLGLSGCEEWKAFLAAGKPSLPPKTFAIGPVFRVELAKGGQIAWSENDSTLVVYNAGTEDDLKAIRIIRVRPDNASEERQTEAYLRSAFNGARERASPFQAYLASDVLRPYPTIAFAMKGADGEVGIPDPTDVAYMRQRGKKIYLFMSSFHGNAYEPDSHPVLYLGVLAAPD